MGQVITSGIKIVPKEGEIEITLNINITLDGKIIASADNAQVSVSDRKEKEVEASPMIPDFSSGTKLNFGKPK